MTITSLNIQDGTFKERRCRSRMKKRYVVTVISILIILIIFAIYMLTRSSSKPTKESIRHQNLTPPNPQKPLPPSPSILGEFQKGAVSSDAQICSSIGKDILERNGSAVDAALATMFCNGLVTMQSMGLGGGFFMTVYSKEKNKVFTLNAREMAPLAAKEDMFSKDPQNAKVGALAIAVPGELAGYIAAHNKFGNLEWKELIQPTIELCKTGYNISNHQANALRQKEEYIKNDTVLKELFFNADSTLKTVGDLIMHKKYCKTLELIAKDPYDLYNGTLGDILIRDITELNGIITKQDLLNYEAKWEEPIKVQIKEDTFYFVQPPGSGSLLGLILNILEGYNFTEESINGINNTVTTYHRIIEAFKYTFAQRSTLGDPDFLNITNQINILTSPKFADMIRNQIKDTATSDDPTHYGLKYQNQDDHGTAHISVLAPNGDAVSVTSTINLYFGSAITSENTGIILNSGMDDFSSSGFENFFGLPYAPANKIVPGKRPLSSMSPSIVLDKDNNVKMVIGAAGGTKITTAVALVIMKSLWFGENIKEAIDAPRLHHQVYPMEVDYQFGFLAPIVEGLEDLGHKMVRTSVGGSVVNAIFCENGTIYANADYRKEGNVDGF